MMPANPSPKPHPHVPTESPSPEFEDLLSSQRRALEEMSQHLLDKLNVMVVEQETRAKEFAQRVQSVSPLPQQGDWSASVKPSQTRKEPPPPPQRKSDWETSQRTTHGQQKSPNASGVRDRFTSLSEKTMEWMTEGASTPAEKANNKGCFFLIIVLFIIYMILKFL